MRQFTASKLLKTLFCRRRQAPWACYLLPAFVAVWFGLWSIEDSGLTGVLFYGALLAVSVIQMCYRTAIGWAVLLLPCLAYTVAVAVTPGNGSFGEYIVFLLTGLVPTVALAMSHPFRSCGKNDAESEPHEVPA